MDVNVSQTQEYYHSITKDSMCDCSYCRSYRLQIKSAFPKVAEYLDSLGIDIEKPFETSPLEPDENGMLEYCCCQYIAFGNCEPNYHHRIGNVEFRMATSYPKTGIEQEHFVLEFYPIKLEFDEGDDCMNDKKKALISAVLCSICALIWIIAGFANFSKLTGTTVLILIICAAIAFVVGAVVWFIRYMKLDKSNE